MRTTSPKQNIPSLDNLFEVTRDWIRNHQGEKGYINTDNPDGACDDMYAIVNNYYIENVDELRIIAVREKDCDIEIALDWKDNSNLATEEDLEKYFKDSNNWYPILGGDVVHYTQTLFEIAGSIEQYMEE